MNSVHQRKYSFAAATAAGLKYVIVPSRLTAGRPFAGAYKVLGDIRAGKLRVIATVMEKRLAAFPDTPTLREQGMGGPPGKRHNPLSLARFAENAKNEDNGRGRIYMVYFERS